MPISAVDGYPVAHWTEVFSIVKEALSDTEFSVELVSDSDEIGIIQKRIVQNIYNNEIVICDVSTKNPNVMFELGMRLAFDKPAIIIKDDRTNYSFDTAPIEHLEYRSELHYPSIQTFKVKLREKVLATAEASRRPDYTTFLKHFGQFIVAGIEQKQVSKDDFLLEVVSELRKEINALGKGIHNRGPIYGVGVNELRNQIEKTRSKLEVGMYDFLRTYWGEGNLPALDDVTNPESEVFTGMLQDYLLSSHAPVLRRDLEQVKDKLMDVASKFLKKSSVSE